MRLPLSPALGLAALLAGCGARPSDHLGWVERWELLGVLDDGGVLDARLSVGNTDLLRGEGHLRLDRWEMHQSPLLAGIDAPPQAVDLDLSRGHLRLPGGALERDPEGAWRLTVSSEGVSGAVTLTPSGAPSPTVSSTLGGGQWAEEALVPQGALLGWIEAQSRGGMMRGRGVLLHRGGDGWPGGERTLAVVLCEGLSLGLDLQGAARFAWARQGEQALDVASAALRGSENDLILDYRPSSNLWAELKLSALGERDGEPDLLLLERPFSSLLRATETRQLWRALAEVHAHEQTQRCSGLVLRER